MSMNLTAISKKNASTQGCLLLAIQLLICSISSLNVQGVFIVKDL
jgi:hypothetical protein